MAKMKTLLRTILYVFPLSLVPGLSAAHHSMAIYDTQQEVSVNGTVTRVLWRNPHVYIYIDQTLDSGEVVGWEIEGLPPAGFRRVGWNQDTLAVGDQVSVSGNPTRNIARRGIYPVSMTHGGRLLYDANAFFQLAMTATDAQGGSAQSIEGVWATVLNMDLMFSLGEGADFPNLTEAGELAVAEFEEQSMNPAADCAQITPPLSMFIPTMNKIEITDDRVTITGDYDSGQRIIYLDEEYADRQAVSQHGYSIGRWEGTTLEVTTSHFAEHRMGNGWGLPSSAEKQMLERFALSEDGLSLSYEFTLIDPVYMTQPFQGVVQWKPASNLEFDLDPCDLTSARRFIQN